MAFDELMGLTNRLLADALALAAMAARVRLDELGERGDPALREQLDRVLDELGVRWTAGALALLEGAGFTDVGEIERTWNPPLRFVVGTRR